MNLLNLLPQELLVGINEYAQDKKLKKEVLDQLISTNFVCEKMNITLSPYVCYNKVLRFDLYNIEDTPKQARRRLVKRS